MFFSAGRRAVRQVERIGEEATRLRWLLEDACTNDEALAILRGASRDAFDLLIDRPEQFDPGWRDHPWHRLLRSVMADNDNDLFDRFR